MANELRGKRVAAPQPAKDGGVNSVRFKNSRPMSRRSRRRNSSFSERPSAAVTSMPIAGLSRVPLIVSGSSTSPRSLRRPVSSRTLRMASPIVRATAPPDREGRVSGPTPSVPQLQSGRPAQEARRHRW